MKLPISALVVGYNEGHLLKNCLTQLLFCDEIIYIDLGSTDDSAAIAGAIGAEVIHHEKVTHVEIIHTELSGLTKNDWILLTDPDEVIDSALVEDITKLFEKDQLTANVGAVSVPIVFYFKNRQLKGTKWGGVSNEVLLVHKKRIVFSTLVHAGRTLVNNYSELSIPFKETNYIHHYWMDGYQKLLRKHLRYLKNEARARYELGRRVQIKQLIKVPYFAFKYSYLQAQGYKDGPTGIFLSLFWAWYEFAAQLRTYRYQIKNK